MNKEQTEKEARAVNEWAKKAKNQKTPCAACNGTGRASAPLFGDLNLGYSDAGPCTWCKGTKFQKD